MTQYTPLFTTIPPVREERWALLAEFASFWHGVDCPPVDYMRNVLQTEAKLHVTIPNALIEWHSRFGRFINLWSDRTFTAPISRLQIESGAMIIRCEPLFGRVEAKWGIPLSDIESDDPQVVSILGPKTHPCANSLSEFAIFCALFDTINSRHTKELPPQNSVPFPPDGQRAAFPESFGIIKTEFYEGPNWLALVSGTDWYLRRRDPKSNTDHLVKHELRTKGLPP